MRPRRSSLLEFDVTNARKLFEAGYTFVAVGSDTGIIARRSEALLAEIQAELSLPA